MTPAPEEWKTLLRDHATIKEAFIVEQLQGYMDLTTSPPTWVESVKLRLQEKEDWVKEIQSRVARKIFEKYEKYLTYEMSFDEKATKIFNKGAYHALSKARDKCRDMKKEYGVE